MKKKRDSNIMNPVNGTFKPPPPSPPNSVAATTLSPVSNPISFIDDYKRRKEKKGFDFANLAKSVLDDGGESKSNGSQPGGHLIPKAIDRISNGHLPPHSVNVTNPSSQLAKYGQSAIQGVSVPTSGVSGHIQLPSTYNDYLQKQLAFFAAAAAAAHFGPGFPFPPTYVETLFFFYQLTHFHSTFFMLLLIRIKKTSSTLYRRNNSLFTSCYLTLLSYFPAQ